MAETESKLYCGFCGKGQHEVKKLIAGPTLFICNECVDLCGTLLMEEGLREPNLWNQLPELRKEVSHLLDSMGILYETVNPFVEGYQKLQEISKKLDALSKLNEGKAETPTDPVPFPLQSGG